MSGTNRILLGVNVDHVATLRQARGINYPDPVLAAEIAMRSGADSITVHLREDRRHIQEADVRNIKALTDTPLNLEMAGTMEMCQFARKIRPDFCCIVPEKRQELTTEGGLDVCSSISSLHDVCKQLQDAGIRVSMFIDADAHQIQASKETGADMIEIHTGHYANASVASDKKNELTRIRQAVQQGIELGLQVNAGHGLHYDNVSDISGIPGIVELNIGHAIIARAVISGMQQAVSDMKQLMLESRK